MSDDTEGRVIPFPAVGIRSPIGGDGAAGTGPDPDPPAGSTGPLLAPLFDEAESAGPPGGYPVLSGGRPVPPPSVLLPQLVDEPDGQVLQASDGDGGERLSAAEAATLGVLVASAITVAAVRGTVALAGWFRARAEHHRAVQKKAGHGSGGGRVPSSVEYGRRSLAAHRSNGGGRSSGGGGGKGGGGRVPSMFRSSGGGSSSKRPSSGGGGSSRRSTTTSSGSGGLSSSGSGGKHRKRKPTNGGGGDAGSGGGRKAPRGPRPNKPSKASKAAKGGTESSTSSRTPKKPKRRKQAQADRHGGGGDGGGKLRTLRKLRKHDAPSSKTKGDGGGDKSKGDKGGGKHKPKQTAKSAVTAAARRARRRALRSVRKTANKAVKATRRTVRRNTKRAARKTRSWARIGWERVAARAEARWTHRRSAGGPTGGSSSATPPPGGGSSRSTPPPGGPGPGSGPGPGGPHVGGRRPKPPPAWTDPYVVTLERLDDEPPARTAAGALAPPRHALPATPTAKEAHPVSQPPSRAYGTAPARAAGSVQFAVDSDLTIHDLVESDEEVAAEVLARVDTAQQDARAAEALASRLDDLRVVLTERKVPGRLLGFVNRLIEQAGAVRSHAQALAKALPDASAAIETAGRNAAARHKPLADATRDAGHAAPAERTYHRE